MNTLLLALQLLIADTTQAPIPYAVKAAEKFSWKKYEITVSKHYKDSILDTFKPDYPFYFNNESGKSENYNNAFHFVDLNNDRLPDIVYEGWTGSEGTMVDIYVHRQFRMEKVFTGNMTIMDWTFVNKKLQSVVIYNQGCCAENVEFETHYAVDKNFGFKLVWQRAILVGMSTVCSEHLKAESWFQKPVRFKTLNADYALRYSPEISEKLPKDLDLSLDEKTKGNVIAIYPKGSEGIAWAYKKDATGREWWLVEMDPQILLSFTYYWDSEDEPTHYFGWMSSRFLEKTP